MTGSESWNILRTFIPLPKAGERCRVNLKHPGHCIANSGAALAVSGSGHQTLQSIGGCLFRERTLVFGLLQDIRKFNHSCPGRSILFLPETNVTAFLVTQLMDTAEKMRMIFA